jgi:ATP-dependent RNA helicase DeaD
MNVHPPKLDKLNKNLQQTIETNLLSEYRTTIENTVNQLGIELIDYATALLQITHPDLLQDATAEEEQRPVEKPKLSQQFRHVRYRLDVGSCHGICADEILAVLIEESGVDKQRVGRLEIREHYSLVDLPEGMPADIFQLLSEATLKGQRFNIKRIKPNRKNPRGFKPQPRSV